MIIQFGALKILFKATTKNNARVMTLWVMYNDLTRKEKKTVKKNCGNKTFLVHIISVVKDNSSPFFIVFFFCVKSGIIVNVHIVVMLLSEMYF